MTGSTNERNKKPGWNTAAAVDTGSFGDKTPGFDPAAAPMETDAEAGGFPQPGGTGTPLRAEVTAKKADSRSMEREHDGRRSATHPNRWLPLALLAVIAVAVALWAIWGA
ncbi:hypothetical protein FJW04_17905 [Mesorhizobium sp. B2-7-3]|uniref:hypothetical protein n=1 Tax=Mesorhizobium sp. B2-7-3 TaxID=2589907 RepID=UPI00112A12C3|nr:hypothetical protein [Mesorhizobium sp. B2-7-3]TPJ14363.1 hypothetical protein FJW04_17905 [Mesorhizobium sp. B2-7-3]